jgi:hypothetical protein
MAVWFNLWPFGLFTPFWYVWTKKNLATLVWRHVYQKFCPRRKFLAQAETFLPSLNFKRSLYHTQVKKYYGGMKQNDMKRSKMITWSQSYDCDLQFQRCKNLQRHG